MAKKRTNPKRQARQTPPPQTQQQGTAELTDAALEQVQGGQKLTGIKGTPTDDNKSLTFNPFYADAYYDAEDKGCAEGPLDAIADLMRQLTSGQTLEIRATDPNIAGDLAAWCRLSGHTLVTQQGEYYLLRHQAMTSDHLNAPGQ